MNHSSKNLPGLTAPIGEGVRARAPRVHLRNRVGGFTLLELILVLVVICIALAEAAPQLRGFMIGSRLKNAATDLISATQWARTKAISDGCVYRLTVDQSGYQVLYQDQQSFVPASTSMGQRFDFPDDVKLSLVRQDGAVGDHIDFFPDGTTEPGTFTLKQTNDGQMQVACLSPTEQFHVLTGGSQ